MTDETTPGEPLDPGTPMEPEAPIPSAELEAPPSAGQIDVPEVAAVPEVPSTVVEPDAGVTAVLPEPLAAAPVAGEPVPVVASPVQPASAGLGPAVPSGSRVVVMVSRGPAPAPSATFVTVPEVLGQPQGDALARFQEVGLPTQVFNDYHPQLARGVVAGQLPPQGMTVPAGSEAVLLVSTGPPAAPAIPTHLPNVVGLPEADAVSLLQAAGLSPQIVREYSVGYAPGVAIAQLPNPASMISIPTKRSLTWLWIILALLVVIAIGVGGFLYLNRTGVVPTLTGLSQADAVAAIDAAGFRLGSIATTQTLKASDVGKVVGQAPAANSEARMIDGIDIVVSGGQKLLDVPTVTGKTQSEAEKALADAGLKSSLSRAFSTTVVKGVVISQAPEAGQRVPADTSIGIVVSEGAQNITVPSVTNQSQSQATTTLRSLGLGLQVVTNRDPTIDEGKVAYQFPPAGNTVPPATIIGMVVSLGSSDTTASISIPTVVGRTSSQAQTDLEAKKLKMVAVQWTGTGRPANEVVGQIPDSGVRLFEDESVIVFVSNGR